MTGSVTGSPVLRLQGIRKRFGALVANDDISLELGRGEVLALLGENGAGKSTLVSILFGHYVADAGLVEVFGLPLPPGDTRAALAAGVGMVHQHFTLADNLTVLDNVMLGTEPLWRWRSRRSAGRALLVETAGRFGLAVDPDARVGDLSVGQRQRVEILKALYRGAKVLILDEPTAVLTPPESAALFATLAQLVGEGLSVVFISHKLDEVLRVSHRIAVLRAGRLVATLPATGTSKAQLAELMVGRQVAPATRRPARTITASSGVAGVAARAGRAGGAGDRVACALVGATVAGPGGQRPALAGADLAVHAGEIVAIAGVSGNGQQALAELLFGLVPLTQGSVKVGGRPLQPSPRAALRAGIARIPEDRHAVGAIGDLPVRENAILEHYRSPSFARAGWLRPQAARQHARTLVERFDVRGIEAAGMEAPARRLSGGNLQKLILGRALLGDPDDPTPPTLIVADQPTWGLDVGAVAYVHQQLFDACDRGAGVLLISEDLDEIHALADRIAVIHQGVLGPAKPREQWTLAEIGLAMAGTPHAA